MQNSVIRTVSREEFNRHRSEHIQMRRCPLCCGNIKIEIQFQTYGSDTVEMKCARCGSSFKSFIPSEVYACGESFGTFETADSIGSAVYALSETWNAYAQEQEHSLSGRELYSTVKERESIGGLRQ